MEQLINLKDFEEYQDYIKINESLTDGNQSVCNKVFMNGEPLVYTDGSTVTPKEIVHAVNEALRWLSDSYTRTFSFGQRLNIIYLRDSRRIKTMTVDENLNLYMNAGFIFHTLQMKKEYIGAVIMHEIFHVLFNHFERGKNWVGAQGKSMTRELQYDNGLAADIEVNRTLVRLHIISAEELTNVIHGLYLQNTNGSADVVPMEIILNDEKVMEKLRAMAPLEPDPEKGNEKEKIKTSDEWNKGYKDAWNKIAGLIKKYGYKKAWDKLIEAGIVNGAGEMDLSKEIDDVMGINFIQVKNYDDFCNEPELINEAFTDIKKSDSGQTYDDGFVNGLKKLVGQLYGAIEGGSGGGQGGGQDGPSFDTDVKEDDLDEVELPSPDNDDNSEGSDDGLPQNIKNNKQDQKSQGQGQGGQGKSDDDLTDDDLNTLENDLKNKMKNGGSNSDNDSGEQNGQDGNGSSDGDNTDDNGSGKQSGQDGSGSSDGDNTDDNGSGEQSGQDSAGQQGSNVSHSKSKSNGNGQGNLNDETDDTLSKDLKNKSKGKEKTGDEIEGIGGTGSFIDSNEMKDDILKEAGYNKEDIDKINEVRKINKEKNTPEAIEKAKNDMRNKLGQGNFVSKMLDAIEVESSKYKNIWKEIMEEFMSQQTRMAGRDTPTGHNDWKRKNSIARGEYGIHHKMERLDPQDVNIFVDVSGSMDLGLLEIIGKSLVIFSQEYEYSGINVCPWASTCNGVSRVDDFSDRNEDEVTEEILKLISKGAAQCGGGTDGAALISAMVGLLESEDKESKDDVHVVITDGYFDIENIESRMVSAIKHELERDDAAEIAPEHTFWMIYDADDRLRDRIKNEIKRGKLIFINSSTVKGNG